MGVVPSDIVDQMRSVLALTEPDLDTTIGSVTRKILDAVAESAASTYIDRYLLNYQYDIESKSGADLDNFVQLFGFNRLPPRRATGSITFERTSPATVNTIIPVNSQFATTEAIPTIAVTVVPAVMLVGDTSITVPAQAGLGGSAGNIPANGLRVAATPIPGVGTFSNSAAFTGGTDGESDEQLRDRFKKTVFRNLAGTEQMFLAVALENQNVSQVNVIGASKRHREQIQLDGSGAATSTVVGARYVYPNSSVLGQGIDLGNVLTPGVHYSFATTTPPSVQSLDNTQAPPNGIFDFEFEYVPSASRNDPTGGVTNRVDVYVNGSDPAGANETAIFHSAKVFNATANDPLNATNFQRLDSTQPTVGNYFVPFSFAPVIEASEDDTITINGIVYTEGTDYWTVNDVSRDGGSFHSLSGIEIRSAANGATLAIPADGTSFSVAYVFNAVPRDVEEEIRAWRLITTDVRVHQAKPILLNFYFAVVLLPGYTLGGVQALVEAAIRNYVNGVGFGGVVQVSDLLEVVHSVPGIDAVRFYTSSDDATHYAIQGVSSTGSILNIYATPGTGGQVRRAIDVIVGDDEVPYINSVTLALRAQNSMGAV